MLWAGYTSQHRAIRLHLCFELNRTIPAQFLVDTGKSNEKKALLRILEAGVTYIADRRCLSFSLLAALAAAYAFFVIRAKANLVYICIKRLPVTLPGTVQHLFSVRDRPASTFEERQGAARLRLVSFFVGQEQYLILTSRLDLTTLRIILLYACYWQVEILFRVWKSHARVDEWRSRNPWRILSELYARLAGQVILHWMLLTEWHRFPDRSLFKAARLLQKLAIPLALFLRQGKELKGDHFFVSGMLPYLPGEQAPRETCHLSTSAGFGGFKLMPMGHRPTPGAKRLKRAVSIGQSYEKHW